MCFLVNCGHAFIYFFFHFVGILVWKLDIFINWLYILISKKFPFFFFFCSYLHLALLDSLMGENISFLLFSFLFVVS
jgi:hypothetical protein